MVFLKAFKSCFKLKVNFFQKVKTETTNHLFYRCQDAPYGLISFEILIRIRNSIESTQEPVDKHYYRLLEKFIYILDRLNQENSEALLSNYFLSLNKARTLETNSKYTHLIDLTFQSMKLGLKLIDFSNTINIKNLEDQINELQQNIRNFRLQNKESNLINSYCKILYKLPKLALIRRGLTSDTISLFSN